MNYNTLPTQAVIDKTLAALKDRNIIGHFAANKAEALVTVKGLIPEGADLMTGSSLTLEQIGLVDLLKSGQHPWHNLKDAIVAEKDPVKQNVLRKQSITADYFLGSVHALTEAGELLVASASGSQIPSYAFASNQVIWVVGAQKIVADLDQAYKRLHEYVFPLEDQRVKALGMPGSTIGMTWVFKKNIMPNRQLHLILVNEALGF